MCKRMYQTIAFDQLPLISPNYNPLPWLWVSSEISWLPFSFSKLFSLERVMQTPATWQYICHYKLLNYVSKWNFSLSHLVSMSSCTERGITSKQTDKTKCLGLWSWATVTFEYCPSTLGHPEKATLLSPNCYEDNTGRRLRFSVFSLVWIRSTNKLRKYAASPYSFFLGEAGVCFSASYQLYINIPSSFLYEKFTL